MAQTVDLDFTEALAYLGIESVSEATVIGINVTDGSTVENAMSTYDGWRNAVGDFQTWGDQAAVCVKFEPTKETAQLYGICDMGNDNVPTAGESFTCKWGLQANGKTVAYVITINFSGEPEYLTFPIVKTITVYHSETEKTAYSGTEETFDVSEITSALGADDIASCAQYLVNASENNFRLNTTDGWRDANGDRAGWGSTGGVCVKIEEPASGSINYIGCYDDTHEAGEVYHALWGFVYNEQAVLVDVEITFLSEDENDVTITQNGKSEDGAEYYATYATTATTDLSQCEFTAYSVTANDTELTYTKETGIVPAGTALVICTPKYGGYGVVQSTSESTAIENNDLKVADGTTTGDGSTIYILAKGSNGLGWYLCTEGTTIKEGKCYLEIETASGAKFIGIDDVASGIANVATTPNSTSKRYNLSGQRVGNGYKGIVIENGKKYLLK